MVLVNFRVSCSLFQFMFLFDINRCNDPESTHVHRKLSASHTDDDENPLDLNVSRVVVSFIPPLSDLKERSDRNGVDKRIDNDTDYIFICLSEL